MEDLTGIVLGGIFLLIPIIAILTAHQQKMARLFREDQNKGVNPQETNMLRGEVHDLRQRIDNLTLSIEQMRDEQRAGRELEQRMKV